MKPLQNNKENAGDLGFGFDFIGTTPKTQSIRKKIHKLDHPN